MDKKIAAAQELALVDGDPSRVTAARADGPRGRRDVRRLPQARSRRPRITDVRPTHGCVFRFVHGDGMRLTELASQAGLTKQSVGEIVDDLTGLGYIERYPDPTDKRAKLIRLTAKGLDAQASVSPLLDKLEEEWAEAFGDDRIAALRALLEDVALAKSPGRRPRDGQPRTRSRPLIR